MLLWREEFIDAARGKDSSYAMGRTCTAMGKDSLCAAVGRGLHLCCCGGGSHLCSCGEVVIML